MKAAGKIGTEVDIEQEYTAVIEQMYSNLYNVGYSELKIASQDTLIKGILDENLQIGGKQIKNLVKKTLFPLRNNLLQLYIALGYIKIISNIERYLPMGLIKKDRVDSYVHYELRDLLRPISLDDMLNVAEYKLFYAYETHNNQQIQYLLADPNYKISKMEHKIIDIICRFGSKYSNRIIENDYRFKPIINHKTTALLRACYKRDLEQVKSLLSNPNYILGAEDNNAIELIIHIGDLTILKVLLDEFRLAASIDKNVIIQLAAKYGKVEIIKYMLQDLEVNPAANYNLAINYAVKHDHIEVVKILLTDSRVTESEEGGAIAVNIAARHDYFNILQLLLAHPKIKVTNFSFIRSSSSAARFYKPRIVCLLLSDSRIMVEINNNALKEAFVDGCVEDLCEILMAMDPVELEKYKLFYAFIERDLQQFKATLQDPNYKISELEFKLFEEETHNIGIDFLLYYDYRFMPIVDPIATKLLQACYFRDLEQVKTLLSDLDYPVLEEEDKNAVQLVTQIGDLIMLKLFLADCRLGSQINKNLILQIGALYGHLEIVKFMLSDPSINPGVDNYKSIINAAKSNNIEVVKVLLADAHCANSINFDKEAINNAAMIGNFEIIQLLFTDSRFQIDENILGYAAAGDNVEIMRFLLDDPRAVNWKIKDALAEACTMQNIEIVKLLCAYIQQRRIQYGSDDGCDDSYLKNCMLSPRLAPRAQEEPKYEKYRLMAQEIDSRLNKLSRAGEMQFLTAFKCARESKNSIFNEYILPQDIFDNIVQKYIQITPVLHPKL